MHQRDLEYLLALVEEGHFGRAAARCGVTQPTLSVQIAQLEAHLQAQLFERQPKGVVPTPQGRAVAAQAAVVLDEMNRLREIARAGTDPFAGAFRLGLIPTAGPYLLPRLLPLLAHGRPDLRLILRESLTASLIERLRTNELDAAIISLPLAERDIDTEPIMAEPFVVALPPGHRLARRKALQIEDLADDNLLFLEDGHCMRDQAGSICKHIHRRRGESPQAGSIESLRQMVHVGMGCALFPMGATAEPFASAVPVEFRRLRPGPPTRTLVLAWRRRSQFSIHLRQLARQLHAALSARA